jgi:hypothetical protein
MAVLSTQPLAEMSTRNLPVGNSSTHFRDKSTPESHDHPREVGVLFFGYFSSQEFSLMMEAEKVYGISIPY